MKSKQWILAAALLLATGVASAANVTVTIHGVQPKGGTVLVALQKRHQFMQPKGAYGTRALAAPGTMRVHIPNVSPGDYAVVVMQDENDNQKMDRRPDGRPAEGWAMSGQPFDQKPRFDDAKRHVPANGKSINLRMTYPKQ